MAKRGKQNREGDEWLAQVTSRDEHFVSWKQAKWWPIGPRRRGPERTPKGNRTAGVIRLVTGILIVGLPFFFLLLYGRIVDLAPTVIIGAVSIALGFVFIRAALEHFRYSK